MQHRNDHLREHDRSSSVDAGLWDILRNHTYVGMADDTLALVQHQTRLYLADAYQLSRDLFYQQVMHSPW